LAAGENDSELLGRDGVELFKPITEKMR
jgi:hypothetical protein